MSIPGAPQKKRWPWIVAVIVGAVVLIGAGIGIGIAATSQPPAPQLPPASSPAPTDAPSDPSTPPPSTAPPENGGGVDACLGGDARDIGMLITARETAPHTVDGAVAFGTAFLRWGMQKPVVPFDEVQIAEHFIRVPDLASRVQTMDQAQGAQLYVSTLNGYYRVESMDDDHVNVSYMLRVVVDGAVDPNNVGFTTLTMQWDGTGWTVTGQPDGASSDTMRETGTPFDGGC